MGGLAGQVSHVGPAAVIAFGPEMCVGVGADQLEGHVDLAAGTRDRAFDDAVDIKSPGNFSQWAACTLCIA